MALGVLDIRSFSTQSERFDDAALLVNRQQVVGACTVSVGRALACVYVTTNGVQTRFHRKSSDILRDEV